MVRRAVVSDLTVDAYGESAVVVRRSVASVVANALSAVYVLVLSVVGLDTLLRALGARRGNGFVSFVHTLASPLVAPFRTIFSNQQYWATALTAAVVYTIGYVIAMAVLGRDRAY